MYYSEHEQDKWLEENIFKGKRDGLFFECGAIDGLITSNTLFFERERGWTGLCAEAIPEEFESLQKNRSCKVEHCCLADRDGEQIPFLICNTGAPIGWSGALEFIEPQHLERIETVSNGTAGTLVMVPSFTLETLLKKYELKHIDYLSLDIEGAEYKVLKVFPFEEFDIDVWDIEDNFGNYPIEDLLRSKGYKKAIRLGPSDIYIKAKK